MLCVCKNKRGEIIQIKGEKNEYINKCDFGIDKNILELKLILNQSQAVKPGMGAHTYSSSYLGG